MLSVTHLSKTIRASAISRCSCEEESGEGGWGAGEMGDEEGGGRGDRGRGRGRKGKEGKRKGGRGKEGKGDWVETRLGYS